MQEAHRFSRFIAVLARGKTKIRSFTLEESVHESQIWRWCGEAKCKMNMRDAAGTGTLAIALKPMGRADTMEGAQMLTETMWAERENNHFPLCA